MKLRPITYLFFALLLLVFGCKKEVDPISIVTFFTSDITSTTANIGGRLPNLGEDPITEWGIIWSATAGLSDANGTKVTAPLVSDRKIFNIVLTDLTPATQYYFKSYVVAGGAIYYGAEQTFTTTTPGKINLSTTSAFTGDTITLNGENFETDITKMHVRMFMISGTKHWAGYK